MAVDLNLLKGKRIGPSPAGPLGAKSGSRAAGFAAGRSFGLSKSKKGSAGARAGIGHKGRSVRPGYVGTTVGASLSPAGSRRLVRQEQPDCAPAEPPSCYHRAQVVDPRRLHEAAPQGRGVLMFDPSRDPRPDPTGILINGESLRDVLWKMTPAQFRMVKDGLAELQQRPRRDSHGPDDTSEASS